MRWLVLLLLTSVSACAPGSVADPCPAFRPIRPSPSDIDTMSGALLDQLLSHNEIGQRLCGWAP